MSRGPRGLYAIVDMTANGELSPVDLTRDYLAGGASNIQLRDKKRIASGSSRERFWSTAKQMVAFKKRYSFNLIVNDDLEVAREVGADGVHIGKDDASIEECRKVLGKGKLIGYSAHSLVEAIEAERRGADYVSFGAIFPSPIKGPGHPVQGAERLAEVVRTLAIPVVAIGGIGRDNIKEVLATGVAAVAMISALASARDRVQEARFFSRLLGP